MLKLSHWRTYNAKVLEDINMSTLEKSVADMGLSLDTSIKNVANSYGRDAVDAGLKKDTQTLALGFQFTETKGKIALSLRGDFWGTGLNESQFMDKLAQHYQKNKAIDFVLPNQGYTVESCTLNEQTNEYEVLAYQYA